MPFHANGGSVGMGTGRGKGCYKPMLPGSTPLLQKRTFGLLGSKTIANGKRFEGTTKRLCAKEEPRYEAEVIVPNVCLNKQVDMSTEDCDVVTAGSNSDDDHQQQQKQQNKVDSEAESDSESDSSSDGSSSSSSNSDSRTRSMEAGEDCKAAHASRPCNDQKASQLQPSEKEYCDSNIAESRGIIKRESETTLNDQKATVQEHIHNLELEAYSNLMKAFHACGKALSWEKVELLSDLRTHLHITNDEHLQVLNVILNRKRRRFAGSQF